MQIIHNIPIKVIRNTKFNLIPSFATPDSAGMDLMAAIDDEMEIKPMQRVSVPTGIAIALKPGLEAQVRPRSGLAIKNGITVLNTPGTIDADYRGEICVILINLSDQVFKILPGMRIAQMVIATYEKVQWQVSQELDQTTRGDGGFGSTGL